MTHPDLTLVQVPEPSQIRSRQALERLLAVGEELLANNRFEEASVAEIASLADSSVGTFYRLLGDKDTLSLLLLQRFMQKLADTTASLRDAGAGCRDLAEGVRLLTDTYIDIYTGRRGVLRAVILRASRSAAFRDRVHQLNTHISSTACDCLEPFMEQVLHSNPQQAVASGVHMVLGALNQHTVTGTLGGLPAGELRDEIARLLLGYLRGPQ
ncbi:transcriptional regulator, TetR family [Microbulbifer donghaiensis]|uniref:Transcriptional regulator, TetR family n=1 Tax=Microbulbifer donghaiensis TaxID=494016 RepID=A0A1M4XMQ5_9GAMM|nr:TetR/AcrR family transcriptional regulator [Microbulbifer donghaiensis]SHE94765.1 transcriptional regulator, TetR family [Microbulbifer donghaiensis]